MSEKYIPASGATIIKEYIDNKVGSLANVAKTGAAEDITFDDGETFQYKYDNGQLTGPAGIQGPAGPTGPTGPAGANGKDGAAGSTGPQGPAGTTPHIDSTTGNWFIGSIDTKVHAQGPAGPQGNQGATGSVGPAGPAGAAGAQGPKGNDGISPHIDESTGNWFIGNVDTKVKAQGPQGPTGLQGATGPAGSTGPQGPKGDAGPIGPQGPTGSQGPTGPAGPNIVSTSTATSGLAGLLKASGNKVAQAVAGTDYVVPINYQLGEVATGAKWINGKPIYRYVISRDLTLNANVNENVVDLGFSVGELIKLEGTAHELVRDGGYYSLLTATGSTTNSHSWTICVRLCANRYIQIELGASVHSSNSGKFHFNIVLEYTEADPSAIPPLPEGPEIFDEPPYADEGLARADYVAMMSGIEIPAEATGDVQAGMGGMESPGIDGETPPSVKFDTAKLYYDAKVWNAQMVKAAVGKWITAGEADKILNKN